MYQGLQLNNISVITPDILAENGIVHAIDSVILSKNEQIANGTKAPVPAPTPNQTNGQSTASSWSKQIHIFMEIHLAVAFAFFY